MGLIESIGETIGMTLRGLKTWAFGRGLLMLAVIAASVLTGGTGPAAAGTLGFVVPLIVAAGGAVLSAAVRFANQREYENGMIDLYRDDIAQRFGIDPEQVTGSDLREAAKSNEVIAQALSRQRSRNFIYFATSALAAFTTFGLLNFSSTAATVTDIFKAQFGDGTGGFMGLASTGLVAGACSLVLQTGLELLIGSQAGLGRVGAHDQIVALDKRLSRGLSVSKEQVYGVMVAGSSRLQGHIQQRYGKPYNHMHKSEQSLVLGQLGVSDQMENLATQINERQIHPGKLSYLVSDAISPPMLRQKKPAPVKEPSAHPILDTSHGFVQKLGLTPRNEALSHTTRVEASRTSPAERSV